MSIHFISGKPGGGKSLYAVKLMVKELVHGTRPVVTNLPLDMGGLNAYLQSAYPEKSINLFERVRQLDDETESGTFWLHRGPGVDVPTKGEGKEAIPDYPAAGPLGPVMYIIDEFHSFFNAREWMKTGKGGIFYASQHRKLGDDLLCVTQQISNVDKQFRGLAQDFTYLRNHAKERLMGMRSLNRFTRKTYQEPFTGGPGQQVSEWGSFKLDVTGLGSCYKTAQGVGIHGEAADTQQKSKGLSVLWIIPAGLILLVVLFKSPDYFIKKLFGSTMITGQAVATNTVPVRRLPPGGPVDLTPTNPVKPAASSPVGVLPDGVPVATNVPVYVSAMLVNGTHARVFLTDGRSYSERDRALQALDSEFAVIEGKIYRFAPLGLQESVPVPGVVGMAPRGALPGRTIPGTWSARVPQQRGF